MKAYLRTCVVNSIHNKLRAEKVRAYAEFSEAGQIASNQNESEQWAVIKEESLIISDALTQIPFEQREVIVLHIHGDMKFREIAKLQSVSLKTIQSRYRYGLDLSLIHI